MPTFLDRATQVHQEWKNRLLAAIDGGEIPDRNTACADDCCELGRWIHGDGQAFKDHPAFRDLQERHRAFHASVGAIIDLLAARKIEAAKHALTKGEFTRLSMETVVSIARLRATTLIKD